MQKDFFKRKGKEAFLFDTRVENLFISEYMVDAPGDFVKIYLFALMYSDLDENINNEIISKHLSIPIEEILKAWSYWESLGIVKKHYHTSDDRFRYQLEFINIRELFYGKNQQKGKRGSSKNTDTKGILEDSTIKDMFSTIERVSGRLLGGKEPTEIMSWINDYGATPEMIVYAFSYCIKTIKKDSFKYIGAVVKEWSMKGLVDVNKIEKYLEEVDNRYYVYKRVLKALGFSRNATEEERNLIDSWIDEMGFTIDKILEACGKTTGIPNPNMNYINKILVNWSQGDNGNRKGEKKELIGSESIFKYYESLREEAIREAALRRDAIYSKYPRIKEIDEELKSHGSKVSKIIVSGSENKKEKIEALKIKADKLSLEKAYILTEGNQRVDIMEVKYKCDLCNDTGTNDMGERCSCFKERLNELDEWQKRLKNSKA